MTSHTILLEILKILLVATFLFLFITFFKRAVLIGKFTNEYLLKNHLLEEESKKKLIKKTILKFITSITFNDDAMKFYIDEVINTPEFIKKVKKLD